MRRFIGFLLLMMLAACAAPVQPTAIPTEIAAPIPQSVHLDGTFATIRSKRGGRMDGS